MEEKKIELFELFGSKGNLVAKGVYVNEIDYGFWIERNTDKIYYAR